MSEWSPVSGLDDVDGIIASVFKEKVNKEGDIGNPYQERSFVSVTRLKLCDSRVYNINCSLPVAFTIGPVGNEVALKKGIATILKEAITGFRDWISEYQRAYYTTPKNSALDLFKEYSDFECALVHHIQKSLSQSDVRLYELVIGAKGLELGFWGEPAQFSSIFLRDETYEDLKSFTTSDGVIEHVGKEYVIAEEAMGGPILDKYGYYVQSIKDGCSTKGLSEVTARIKAHGYKFAYMTGQPTSLDIFRGYQLDRPEPVDLARHGPLNVPTLADLYLETKSQLKVDWEIEAGPEHQKEVADGSTIGLSYLEKFSEFLSKGSTIFPRMGISPTSVVIFMMMDNVLCVQGQPTHVSATGVPVSNTVAGALAWVISCFRDDRTIGTPLYYSIYGCWTLSALLAVSFTASSIEKEQRVRYIGVVALVVGLVFVAIMASSIHDVEEMWEHLKTWMPMATVLVAGGLPMAFNRV